MQCFDFTDPSEVMLFQLIYYSDMQFKRLMHWCWTVLILDWNSQRSRLLHKSSRLVAVSIVYYILILSSSALISYVPMTP